MRNTFGMILAAFIAIVAVVQGLPIADTPVEEEDEITRNEADNAEIDALLEDPLLGVRIRQEVMEMELRRYEESLRRAEQQRRIQEELAVRPLSI